MKTIRSLAFAPLLAALALGGCSRDDSGWNDGQPTVVQFTASVDGVAMPVAHTPKTRTTVDSNGQTEWKQDDAVGIFMLTTGSTLPGDISPGADNVEYTATPATPPLPASFAPANAARTIYYPQAGAVDFIAYYPYRTTPGSDPYIYKVSVADQDDPAAIDLLYVRANNGGPGYGKQKEAVALTFDHKLSRVVLNIKAGTGMTDANLAGVTVKITGMPTTADFVLTDGTFSNKASVANIETIAATTTQGYAATCTAIVVPQEANAYTNRTMVFTLGSTDYIYDIPYSDDFASGNSYTYNIAVNEKSVTVTRGDITTWTGTDSSGYLGEAKQILPQTVKIPAGKFWMGSPPAEPNRDPSNETQHEVTLTKDFYMGKYPVTFAQYDAFCEATGKGKPSDWGWGRGKRPVINVTWYDAMAYCKWLSEVTGRTWTLPTEAQWEYACRGDYPNKATEAATLPFGIGNGKKLVGGMANFYIRYSYDLGNIPPGEYNVGDNDGYLGKTSIVGSYSPNNYGLYDMHGNVWEWCLDSWDGSSDYAPGAVEDPVGDTGSNRVLRGGSWNYYAQNCRSAVRISHNPGDGFVNIGFRVVLVP